MEADSAEFISWEGTESFIAFDNGEREGDRKI